MSIKNVFQQTISYNLLETTQNIKEMVEGYNKCIDDLFIISNEMEKHGAREDLVYRMKIKIIELKVIRYKVNKMKDQVKRIRTLNNIRKVNY